MAEQTTGVIFTQDGVPVRGSADYQRVLDTRWRFMEVELDSEFEIDLPAVGGVGSEADRYFEKTALFNHGLGFIPLFETNFEPRGFPSDGRPALWADEKEVFVRRLISTAGAAAMSVSGRVRVYNLPILTEYSAPKGFVVGSSSPQGHTGAQFLEESGGVDLGDVSPIGFSLDTRKKILSIHKHGLKFFNEWAGPAASVTAINTATDTLTIAALSGAPYDEDFTWALHTGVALQYIPGDFFTYPGGLSDATFYVIEVDATHIKLASSYENALAGTAINITSAGSLPAEIRSVENPSDPQDTIEHDLGYPPTFLMAETNWADRYNADPENELYIGPLKTRTWPAVMATGDLLRFTSFQVSFTGEFGYVILKDPVEVAG